MKSPSLFRNRFYSPFFLAAGALLLAETGLRADAFTWGGVNGTWSTAPSWVEGVAPPGTVQPDQLTFAGNVTTPYTSTNDLNGELVNQILLNATGASTGTGNIITGNQLVLGGTSAVITQSGTGPFTINTPLQLTAPLTLAGDGTGQVTLNNTLSGNFNITKSGASIFRFGTPFTAPQTGPSSNTWFGNLFINGGTIRFNNNAFSAPTALRSNGVTLAPSTFLTSTFGRNDPNSSLRLGTLSSTGSTGGTVEARRNAATTATFDSADIVITTLADGSFGGTIRNTAQGTTEDDGIFIVRGVGTQTLRGTLQISKDVAVGRGATITLDGNATLAGQATGSIILNGGSFKLDNRTTNLTEPANPSPALAGRLRLGSATSTTLDTTGGGLFQLLGNVAGTIERVGRMQLGATDKTRSGQLEINITHSAAAAPTRLEFQSYNRDNTIAPVYATVNFTATNGTGAPLALGTAGSTPRISFTGAAVTTNNQVISNSGGTADWGWATVNGTDFASYDLTNGVRPVPTAAFPAASASTLNAFLDGNAAANAVGPATFSLNSLKIAPTASGGHLDVTGTGPLNNRAFLLAGAVDYTIQNAGGGTGGISGGGANRYFFVEQATLNVNVSLNGAATAGIVKSGDGTLSLGASNVGVTAPLVINAGTVRSSLANLPGGDVRFRGGVLELTGGGSFTRALGTAAGQVNWSGFDNVSGAAIDEDRGSGGFAAQGSDATINLGGATPATTLTWEDARFLNSGHALVIGSRSANSLLDWTNPINLAASSVTINYNAREFRVLDNPSTAADVGRISGVISGTVQNDLLKTGPGTLELTAANTFQGATIVHEGVVLVNGSTGTSFVADVRNGATLGGGSDSDSLGVVGGIRVESGGLLSPGNVLGNTSILKSGDLDLQAGGRLAMAIGGLTAGGNGTAGYDQLRVTGSVSLNGAQLEGTLLNGFSAQPADLLFLVINDGADAVRGTFAQGSSVTFFSQAPGGFSTFAISYTADSGTNSFGGGNDIALRLIPEPTSALLLGSGLLLLAGRRRRSARVA